ncbi:MAG: bifunctional hydroxymethylpyrimidine kinase/phosphomethylpyrimidine kinase [Acidimicrobiales bacterium]
MTPPIALSIAGSDSGGGAGAQADLRTFAALGVLGTTALTCVTAQNTVEVRALYALPPGFVREQVEAVIDDMAVTGAKTGLLATEGTVKEVAALAPRLPPLVVDPVLVASTGRPLAEEAVARAYRDDLLPLCAVVTPNLAEAARLLGREAPASGGARYAREAARRLGELAPVVVVKGGHLADPHLAVDVVWDGTGLTELSRPRVPTANTHGSGCSFSAAIAAGMARSLGAREAIEKANAFVHIAIQGGAGWRVGAGPGPLDHFGWEEDQP